MCSALVANAYLRLSACHITVEASPFIERNKSEQRESWPRLANLILTWANHGYTDGCTAPDTSWSNPAGYLCCRCRGRTRIGRRVVLGSSSLSHPLALPEKEWEKKEYEK
jgi:hypothetical protein